VVLNTAKQYANMTRREADLAVRSQRPTSPDLISRHLARQELGMYASKAYLKAHGEPEPGSGMRGHDVVIYQRTVVQHSNTAICGESFCNARVAMEVMSGLMMIEAIPGRSRHRRVAAPSGRSGTATETHLAAAFRALRHVAGAAW